MTEEEMYNTPIANLKYLRKCAKKSYKNSRKADDDVRMKLLVRLQLFDKVLGDRCETVPKVVPPAPPLKVHTFHFGAHYTKSGKAKRGHKTLEKAKDFAKKVEDKHGRKSRIYQCRLCNKFHLTTSVAR